VALGAATQKDTVKEVLRKVVETSRDRRRRALGNRRRIADKGGFDFDRLNELDA